MEYRRKPRIRTVFVGFAGANSIDAFSDVVPICQLCVALLSRPPVQLRPERSGIGRSSYRTLGRKKGVGRAHCHRSYVPFGIDSGHQFVGRVATFLDARPQLDRQRYLTERLVHPYQDLS